MLRPIETRYAGCRFRSRLEARYAVFFDAVDIAWQYEAQGYVTSPRLTSDGAPVPYLPDFHLPQTGALVEVKGALDAQQTVRLLDIAASLSSQDGGGCGNGPDLIVLGPLPERADRLPARLHMHKGDLQASPWDPTDLGQQGCGDPRYVELAADYGGDGIFAQCGVPGTSAGQTFSSVAARVGAYLLAGMSPHRTPIDKAAIARAYAAARSARFEHGENGARG